MIPDLTQIEPYFQANADLLLLCDYRATRQIGEKILLLGKTPLRPGWRTSSVSEQIARAHAAKGGNLGVRLRPAEMVIDVDPRNFPPGRDSFRDLEAAIGTPLLGGPEVRTGSGGRHLYLIKPADLPVMDSLPDFPGVEFKAFGRYVVSAGSIHPNGAHYLWEAGSPPLERAPPAPEVLLRLIRRPSRGLANVGAGKLTAEQLEVLLGQLPVEDFQDHDSWFQLMAACHHATAGEGRSEFINWSIQDPKYADQGWPIGRRWDSLHLDPGGAVTYKTLYAEVAKRGGDLPSDDPSESFGKDPEFPVPGGGGDYIDNLNERYCVVNDGGRFVIYSRCWDPPMRRAYYGRSTRYDFESLLGNQSIQTADGKSVPLAKLWLGHPRRRQFEGVVFDPEQDHPGYLNLWTGWPVEPCKGDWSLLRDLIWEVLAKRDPDSFAYILNWCANMVQHPGSPGETALVLRGPKGTGKGTFGRVLLTLAGPNGIHLSSPEALTGKFNAHLRNCIYIFADEAFWAGDKAGEGNLKRTITEPTLFYEPKHVDGQMGRNMTHVVIASNEDWTVPASGDERRWAVFDVDPRYKGDGARWDAINTQLAGGGLAAFFYDLRLRDLGGWHPRKDIPQNPDLVRQKLRSLDAAHAWWLECLRDGFLPQAAGDWEEGPIWIGSRNFYQEFIDASRGMNARSWRGVESTLLDRLSGILRVEVLRRVPPDGIYCGPVDSRGRVRLMRIPPLAECREAFQRYLGGRLDWASSTGDIAVCAPTPRWMR